MNRFHAMFRQGATVIVVIILAIAAFWLVIGQAQPGSQPTAQDTDRPTPPPATPKPTIPPPPLPTDTPTATPKVAPPPDPSQTPFTPEVSFGNGSLVTLPPPGPTSTPTPTSSIRVVNKSPLALNNILAALGTTQLDTPRIVAWTPQEGIVLQMGYPPHEMTWAISPETGQAQQMVHLETTSIQSNEVLAAIDDLKAINSRIQITAVSPNGHWVAGGVIDEPGLLVKQVNDSQPPQILLSEPEDGSFARTLAWAPSSTRLAYAVYTGRYEIRIRDFNETKSIRIKSLPAKPYKITWSPDERLVAFIGREEPQQVTDLYVVRADGTDLANISQDDVWVNGPLAWSPDGRKIAYGDYTQIWLVEIETN